MQHGQSGMQRLASQANQPVACSTCGSTWFYEVTLNQYSNMYSSSAGGDLHPISITSQQIRICVCGRPFTPNIGGVRGGRIGNEAQNSVMAAIEGAIKSRSEVPQMLSVLANDVFTREEGLAQEVRLAALEEKTPTTGNSLDPRIEELEAKLDAILAQLTSDTDPKPAKPGKAGK